uniref:Uncharacterized protein n=1 Tax=Cacopsylla melanoneura TaxID=428564 RepID=A0A8D8XUI6_9HEMI
MWYYIGSSVRPKTEGMAFNLNLFVLKWNLLFEPVLQFSPRGNLVGDIQFLGRSFNSLITRYLLFFDHFSNKNRSKLRVRGKGTESPLPQFICIGCSKIPKLVFIFFHGKAAHFQTK